MWSNEETVTLPKLIHETKMEKGNSTTVSQLEYLVLQLTWKSILDIRGSFRVLLSNAKFPGIIWVMEQIFNGKDIKYLSNLYLINY